MNGRRGFTLVELLVVIAIIALLMAILMPALSRVRKQAKAVICRSNLRQWGVIFAMYTDDNDQRYYRAWRTSAEGHAWVDTLLPYYSNPKILLCPSAKRERTPPQTSVGAGGPVDQPWGPFTTSSSRASYRRAAEKLGGKFMGSYGANEWIGYPSGGVSIGKSSQYWSSNMVKGASRAPVFLGARWLGGFPQHTDKPPSFRDSIGGSGHMGRYCVDRHNGHINVLLADYSVEEVGLKRLWTLKWHREFDIAGPWTQVGGVNPGDWPDWMKPFKEY
jgi:prepilin-type N-terminal cleavage/methylation domain-containing protein